MLNAAAATTEGYIDVLNANSPLKLASQGAKLKKEDVGVFKYGVIAWAPPMNRPGICGGSKV